MSTPEVKPEVKTPKLIPQRIKGAEYARNTHRAYPEATAQLKDVLDPSYWSHVAAKFALYDVVEVIPDGGAWYAQLLVTGCSKQHAKMSVLLAQKLRVEEAPKQEDAPKPKFVVEFKGPQRKWSVIRTSDKAYVKEGFDSKEDAAKWLSENEADLLGLV